MVEPNIFYRWLDHYDYAKRCLARVKTAYMLGNGKALADAVFDYMMLKEVHPFICFLAYLVEG